MIEKKSKTAQKELRSFNMEEVVATINTAPTEEKIELIINIYESLKLSELLLLEADFKTKFNLEDLQLQSSSNNKVEETESAKVTLSLDDIGTLSQVEALKLINKTLKLSISDAKAVVNNLPYTILKDVDLKEAERIRDSINEFKEGLILNIS